MILYWGLICRRPVREAASDRARLDVKPAEAMTAQHRTKHIGETTRQFASGDDPVGNPHRAQICQFELFELISY